MSKIIEVEMKDKPELITTEVREDIGIAVRDRVLIFVDKDNVQVGIPLENIILYTYKDKK